MESMQIDSIDIILIEFKTLKGTVDINPVHVMMVLDESKSYDLPSERNSCVIYLSNGFKTVVSHSRKDVLKKLQRLA